MISQNSIQEILNRIDIIDVVGGFVKLKKRGANYLGLCPFHNERTPSFTVSPSKEIYKCFGCGRSGNTISFVMEHEKYSYVEALRWLATRYGIEIEETFASDEQRQQMQVADSLYIINQFAQQFFTRILFESEEGQDIGLSYFRERGFREETIRKFQLGYDPEQRDAFASEALKAKYNPELLVKSGLVVFRNEQYLDNYRGRVIFPVHNHSGKVLGFGARILKTSERAPKYINTPENEIYVKSKILYGSYQARQAIDKADECLLVEGYTDVISLHQAGIENVVASGGTSLTVDQLRLIRKYTNNLTILYDGDAAGIKAALRGLDLALEEGLNVKLVLLPDKEDPDSYVNAVGAAAFTTYVNQHKKDVILFQVDLALRDTGDDSTKKAALVNQVAETISRINKTEDFTKQQDYIQQCANLLKIEEAGLHALVNKFIRERVNAMERKQANEERLDTALPGQVKEPGNYDDATFNLLFRDDLQEKEFARVLLEFGKRMMENRDTVAHYLLTEMNDEELFDNPEVLHLMREFRDYLDKGREIPDKSHFIYHPDLKLSSFAVSLLNFPYEESEHWKQEHSQSTGYQRQLFEQRYEDFIRTVGVGNEKELQQYLKIQEDRTLEAVDSALNYLKLKKIRRLLVQNQEDLEKPHTPEEYLSIHRAHEHLKQMEQELTRKMGTVILK
ncbi:MAG: DNA primase [Chitinophagaceae bacterium]|nr:DNA primase [Chitinophagaceae bacterium]